MIRFRNIGSWLGWVAFLFLVGSQILTLINDQHSGVSLPYSTVRIDQKLITTNENLLTNIHVLRLELHRKMTDHFLSGKLQVTRGLINLYRLSNLEQAESALNVNTIRIASLKILPDIKENQPLIQRQLQDIYASQNNAINQINDHSFDAIIDQ